MQKKKKESITLGIILAVILILTNSPHIAAWLTNSTDTHFAGYIYNPADAATYLAKMRLGWLGHWQLQLMFTPETHQGSYIYLHYLALGQLARVLHLPLAVVYNAARILGTTALLLTLGWLTQYIIPTKRGQRWAFAFALLGGGLGWAFIWTNPLPVDLWVPEGYAFYSSLANPHFPWAQTLLMLILAQVSLWHSQGSRGKLALISGLLILLSLLQPYALGEVGLIWAVWLGLTWFSEKSLPWKTTLALGICGMIGLLYPIYIMLNIAQDPVLRNWSAQTQTLSPVWWNWLIGYALLIPWAIAGARKAWRQKNPLWRMILAWALGCLIGIALPFNLQRRLCLGLSIPLGLLAGLGWDAWLTKETRWAGTMRAAWGLLLAGTPLFLLLTGLIAPRQQPERFYFSHGEMTIAQTLLDGEIDKVILSTPESGERLPWLTGHKVLVGHPMETANFEERRTAAQAFFGETWNDNKRRALLCRENISYVWWGPAERSAANSANIELSGLSLVIENADARLYAVSHELVCKR